VAFASDASSLVSGDTNYGWDVFVHDRQTGVTEIVSVSSSGEQGNLSSDEPSISADGRFVAFESYAFNLVSGDTNEVSDIFVHDRQTGATERVSVSTSGAQGNDDSWQSSISADGRFVAFQSYASNLVSGDTNDTEDIFIHDRQTGMTELVSVSSSGEQACGYSNWASISADGRFVAFYSPASNLVSGDTNGWEDVFVRDRCPGGVCGDGNGVNTYAISGRVVDHRNQPLPGVTIQTSSGQTVTEANGSFTLSGLLAGQHVLTLSKSGYTFVPVSASNFVVRVPPSKSNLAFVGTPLSTGCEPPFYS